MIASEQRTIAKMDAWLAEMGVWLNETSAGQEATDTCLGSMEETSLEIESEAEHEEVPKEEAAVESFKTLKKRMRGPESGGTAPPKVEETDAGQW
jgi:hypothetical protein